MGEKAFRSARSTAPATTRGRHEKYTVACCLQPVANCCVRSASGRPHSAYGFVGSSCGPALGFVFSRGERGKKRTAVFPYFSGRM